MYDGRLFYGKDAFEGLHTMDRLMELKRSGELDADADFGRALGGRNLPRPLGAASAAPWSSDRPRSPGGRNGQPGVRAAVPRLRSGSRGLALDDIVAYINETALFRNQWGYRPDKGETDADFKARIRPVLREELAVARAAGVLQPAVAYGWFAANGEGDDLVDLEGRDPHRGVAAVPLSPPAGTRGCASPTSSGPSARVSRTTPPSRW